MDTNATNPGLSAADYNGANNPIQHSNLWRPWTKTEDKTAQLMVSFYTVYIYKKDKYAMFWRMVADIWLFWPKSRCFDYLYRDAETLLRNYPVQATICPYEDSSDEESDDEEEAVGKEQN
uniref:Ripply transcriptional repressor 2 n=1 Tax=Cyprinodon variegatus TaxID=28743 RepID=A0A3Q2C8F1_CYPVA